jgi:hypothetical protein
MSILDDAIREHLELKRAHGADDSELKKLEDEAFGPPQRPDEIDPFAEAPTEFLATPGETAADAPEIADEATRSGRRPDIADLQEPPPAAPGPSPADPARMPPPAPEDELSPTPDAPPPSPTAAADVPLPPPPGEAPAADLAPPTGETPAPPAPEDAAPMFFDQSAAPPTDATPLPPAPGETPEAPSDEAPAPSDDAPAPPTDEAALAPVDEAPAPLTDAGAPTDEAPAAAEPEADAGPDAEDRQAIVEQPTQMFDVQAHVDAEAAADAPPTGEQASPTDEELVDAAAQEPQAAPPAPEENVAPPEPEQPQLNLRGPDAEVAGHPPAETEVEEGSAEFDFFNEQRLSDELDQALEAPLPPTEEHLAMPQYKDAPPEQAGIFDFQSDTPSPPREERPYEDDPSAEVLRRADEAEAAEEPLEDDEPDPAFDPETGHEDVLEDTPRFLEDAPEDDDLWFEQKPPKDFDLD